jgi:glutathione S-transferase
MKLYGGVNSPYVRMCMITAHEVGLGARVQLTSANLTFTDANPQLVKLSGIGKVPVLETDHGHALYDSRVIMEYLCHTAGNKSLLPDDGVKRFKVITLLALAQGLSDAAVALRVETAQRPKGLQWNELMDRLKLRINACLNELEANWIDSVKDLNLGSIATACSLAYIDYRHDWLDWRNDHPKLDQFLASFNKRESMTNASLPPA